MEIPDICKQHAQSIIDKAQEQHRQKMMDLHDYHTNRFETLKSRATEKIQKAKDRIQRFKDSQKIYDKHHSALINMVGRMVKNREKMQDKTLDARARGAAKGRMSRVLGDLQDFQAGTMQTAQEYRESGRPRGNEQRAIMTGPGRTLLNLRRSLGLSPESNPGYDETKEYGKYIR